MIPLEKANELVENFESICMQSRSYNVQCAIIAVDEIIGIHFDYDQDKEYWQEVKQHLEGMI